jgi:hypothetical protein
LLPDTNSSPDLTWNTLGLIGLIALNWNQAEERLDHLIWRYIGTPTVGHIITSKLHNMGRIDVLRALVVELEAIPLIVEHIECFMQAFDVLRQNRNKIAHSALSGLTSNGGAIEIERLLKSLKAREYHTLEISNATLDQMLGQIKDLCTYADTIMEIMKKRGGLIQQSLYSWPKPPAWPDRFPLPDKLN